MSTYADHFDALYHGERASGPVRLVLQRGCKPVMEELMDQIDEAPAPPSVPSSAPTLPAHAPFMSWIAPSALLWVLDTSV